MGALSLSAQITATLNTPGEGISEVTVRNDGLVSLSAFAVMVSLTNGPDGSGPQILFDDSLLGEDRPLPPHEQRMVLGLVQRRPGQTPRLDGPLVTAGIFADGTTAGDGALLNRLVLRRCNMLQAVKATLDILTDAGSRNIPPRQLIGPF